MLADLAMRDGQRVVAFDLFGDLDLRRTSASRRRRARGLSALVDAAVAEAPGAVVYGASFENHPALVARLAERHALLGNPPATLRAVRDPARLGAALRDAAPATRGRPSPHPVLPRRWLRKPLRGGGGTRVREWRGGALPAGTFAAGAHRRRRVLGGGGRRRRGRRRARDHRAARRAARVRGPRLPLVREPRPAAAAGRRARGAAGSGARDLLAAWRARSRCAGCSASTSCGTASARGRSRSTRARPRRSRRSRRRRRAFDAHLQACAGELPRIERGARRRGRQGGPVRHRGRRRRRQRALAGARRARRPAPRRADRRGPSDLHRRGERRDARGRARAARGAGRAIARRARAARGGGGRWLTRRAPGAAAPATTSR